MDAVVTDPVRAEVIAFPVDRDAGNDGSLADIELLHGISVALIGEHNLDDLYAKVVDAAVAITGSQFGTMQLLCAEGDPSGHGSELQLLGHRGLPDDAVGYWQWVSPTAHSSCTLALATGQRSIIPDYEAWPQIQGTEDLIAFRRAGIRAAQTTPLRSRDGVLLGMISTHWSRPHTPSDRDLRLLDIVARQAADILERTVAEQALRRSEEHAVLLAREAEHRTKNLLTTVLATVQLSNAGSADELKEVIGGRIQALADVNALFIQSRWVGADARTIIAQELAPYDAADSGRFDLAGEDVILAPETAQALAVTIHELATNAAKYGALSVDTGAVQVEWSYLSTRHLKVVWREIGGPATKPPTRRGFGTRVMQGMVTARGGTLDFSWPREGLKCEIALPT